MSFDNGGIPDFVVEGNEIEESNVVCKVWSIRCWCQFSAKQQTLTFYEEELGKWPWVKTDWKKLQHDVWQHFGHAFNILSTGRKVFYSQQATERKNFELQIFFTFSTLLEKFTQGLMHVWKKYSK